MSREWIVTNGYGGYSSSTIIGANTRKYHGLLIASTDPPWKRRLFLSKLEEEINDGDETFKFSVNKYPGVAHPKGHLLQEKFKLDPIPTFIYSTGELSLEKRVFMPYRKNAVIVNYRISQNEGRKYEFSVRPLINNRGVDSITKSYDQSGFNQSVDPDCTEIYEGNSEPFMYMGSDSLTYRISDLSEEERWYRNMEYDEERKRGFEYREDHYSPGLFEADLSDDFEEFNILVTAGAGAKSAYENLYTEETSKFEKLRRYSIGRLKNLFGKFSPSKLENENEIFSALLKASDSFLVDEGNIIAGYHWFSTWGRDSLIALPGLALVQGRYEEAKEILRSIGKKEKKGLIPNRVGLGEPEYNSADAALLYFYALFKYLTYTDDLNFAREVIGLLRNILEGYSKGTEKVEEHEDGLIWCGEGMTWMDARIDGNCVTPREGKPVEINALWYNALKIFDVLSEELGVDNRWRGKSDKVKRNFRKEFWNSDRECLYDVADGNVKDSRIRPNQLFAMSLPFSLLEEDMASSVLSVLEEKLLTPNGLRSLSKDSPDFIAAYSGDITSKDRAYHQGTVWTWLFGPYLTALKKFRDKTEVDSFVYDILMPFLSKHVRNRGVGTVSEVFDGDEPYQPGGCISQAWSVGEIIRSYVEDFKGDRPQFESEYLQR